MATNETKQQTSDQHEQTVIYLRRWFFLFFVFFCLFAKVNAIDSVELAKRARTQTIFNISIFPREGRKFRTKSTRFSRFWERFFFRAPVDLQSSNPTQSCEQLIWFMIINRCCTADHCGKAKNLHVHFVSGRLQSRTSEYHNWEIKINHLHRYLIRSIRWKRNQPQMSVPRDSCQSDKIISSSLSTSFGVDFAEGARVCMSV